MINIVGFTIQMPSELTFVRVYTSGYIDFLDFHTRLFTIDSSGVMDNFGEVPLLDGIGLLFQGIEVMW